MREEKPAISKSFSDQSNRELKVDYYVTNGKCRSDGADEVSTYGLKLDLYVNGKISDTVEVDDISISKEEVINLAIKFANNLVTPVSLKDVIEDCVAAQLES
ncbi:MAG TPA: DUF6514 family protein [Ruminiclostridium sp.]|nr:DUF6514 family protein [Ruminiclostridium sp.]